MTPPLGLGATDGVDPTMASSGMIGFAVFFLLALAVWLIGRNMTARLRRMNYRHAQEVADAEEAEGAAGEGAPEAPADPEAQADDDERPDATSGNGAGRGGPPESGTR